jgi:multidrug efflux pump subunit AcrA (membrane-fusion protein)
VLDDGRRLDAASVAVFPSADPTTHSVTVRVILPGMADDAPQPGATAKAVFPIAGKADTGAVRVPRSALVQRGEVSGVYVIDGNHIVLRQLRLGRPVGDGIEVLAGLKPGERIAADPVAALQALVLQRDAAGVSHD